MTEADWSICAHVPLKVSKHELNLQKAGKSPKKVSYYVLISLNLLLSVNLT